MFYKGSNHCLVQSIQVQVLSSIGISPLEVLLLLLRLYRPNFLSTPVHNERRDLCIGEIGDTEQSDEGLVSSFTDLPSNFSIAKCSFR